MAIGVITYNGRLVYSINDSSISFFGIGEFSHFVPSYAQLLDGVTLGDRKRLNCNQKYMDLDLVPMTENGVRIGNSYLNCMSKIMSDYVYFRLGAKVQIASSGTNSTTSTVAGAYITVDQSTSAMTLGSCGGDTTVKIYAKTGRNSTSYAYTRVGCKLNGTVVGSTTGSTNSYRLIYTYTIPNNVYKISIRLINQSAASTSTTVYVTLTEYTDYSL